MKQNFSSKHCISNNKKINTINLSLCFSQYVNAKIWKIVQKLQIFGLLGFALVRKILAAIPIFFMQKPMDWLVAM